MSCGNEGAGLLLGRRRTNERASRGIGRGSAIWAGGWAGSGQKRTALTRPEDRGHSRRGGGGIAGGLWCLTPRIGGGKGRWLRPDVGGRGWIREGTGRGEVVGEALRRLSLSRPAARGLHEESLTRLGLSSRFGAFAMGSARATAWLRFGPTVTEGGGGGEEEDEMEVKRSGRRRQRSRIFQAAPKIANRRGRRKGRRRGLSGWSTLKPAS